jgi:TatD DNase family protein
VTGWVDSHCHLHMSDADPGVLLDRAAAAGVEWLVCPGTDAATSQEALDLAGAFPDRVLPAVGLHPHDASRWPEEEGRIAELATRAVGIGECGLDFYRNLSPRTDQIEAFRAQAELAVEFDLPLIVHVRDAFREVFAELEASEAGPRTVLHCWTGGPRWTRRFDDLGVTFSFAGPITYPKGDTVRLAAAVAPRERTMVETDTPFLTPPPDRHLPNEPANVVEVGVALAEVWGTSPDEVARSTSAVATKVFRRG